MSHQHGTWYAARRGHIDVLIMQAKLHLKASRPSFYSALPSRHMKQGGYGEVGIK